MKVRYNKMKEMWCNSCKKMLEVVECLPANAEYFRTNTGHIARGIVLKDERKKYTLYHVHKVGGSNPPYGKFGAHDVYIVR